MFARPQSPTGAIVIGVCAVLSGLIGLTLLFGDFVAETNIGPIVVALIVSLWAIGSYFIALGSVWRARDRSGS